MRKKFREIEQHKAMHLRTSKAHKKPPNFVRLTRQQRQLEANG